MIQTLRTLCAVVLVVLAGLSGCIQAEQACTIFPDGSGKVMMKVAFKKSMLKMMEEMAKGFGGGEGKVDMMSDFSDPEKLMANSEGVAAWSEPRKEEAGEWIRVTTAGYFEDVNKVKIYNNENSPDGQKKRKLSFACKYEKTPAGHVLRVQNETSKDIGKGPGGGQPGADNPELAKAMLEMMKPMLEGLKVAFTVTVPGPIEEATGFMQKKDRTAMVSFDDKLLLTMLQNPEGEEAKKLKALGEQEGGKIAWKENSVGDDEVRAFKKEMAEAKAAWEKLLEEHKKKKAAEKGQDK